MASESYHVSSSQPICLNLLWDPEIIPDLTTPEHYNTIIHSEEDRILM